MINIIKAHNRDNPIPARQLSQLTGLNERALRDEIKALRLQGYPIISNNYGYYYPTAESYDDDKLAIARIKSHAHAEFETARAIEKGLIGMANQSKLFGE